MGDKITLAIKERQLHGKKVKQLRQQGLTPGVVYGPGIEPMSVEIPEGELKKVVKNAGRHTPVHLTGSKRRIAMIKEVDIDPSTNMISHVSFHAVKADEPVVAEVPIRLVGEGESEAEKAGLVILQALDQIEVKALPMDLPEAVEVDITGLKEASEKVTLADAKLPAGVELVDHDDGRAEIEGEEKPSITELMVASVWEPAALEAANAAAAGDAEDESEVEAENGSDDPAPSETDAESNDAPKAE